MMSGQSFATVKSTTGSRVNQLLKNERSKVDPRARLLKSQQRSKPLNIESSSKEGVGITSTNTQHSVKSLDESDKLMFGIEGSYS